MRQILILLLALLPSMVAAQVKKVIDVKPGEDLATLLGDDKMLIDTLELTGELRHADFEVMRECAYGGRLCAVYMGDCVVEGDSIPEEAFMMPWGGTNLDSVVLPRQLRAIGDFAFYHNDIRSIDLPATLKYIGACAFQQCYNLVRVDIPEGVEEIGTNCFRECYALEEASLPSTVRRLGIGIFAITRSLKTIHLAEGIKSIGQKSFWQGGVLEEMDIPQSVSLVAPEAFMYCSFLRRVSLPDGLTDINFGTFEECGSLSDVRWPSALEVIHDRAFYNCGFTSLTLPDGLTHICNEAFRLNRELECLVLPGTLTNLGYRAFAECAKLGEVYSVSVVPPAVGNVSTNDAQSGSGGVDVGLSPFAGMAEGAVLYVPIGAKAAYEAAQYWQDFGEIRETADFPTSVAMPSAWNAGFRVMGGKGSVTIIPSGEAVHFSIHSADGRTFASGSAAHAVSVGVASGLWIVEANGTKAKVLVE